MKTKNIILAALLTAGLGLTSNAQIVTATGDLLGGFRKTGSASEVVVDLGNVSTFESLAAGTTIDLTSNLGTSTLTSTFGGSVTGVKWGVFGATVTGDTIAVSGVAAGTATENTLWATSTNGAIQRQTGSNQSIPAGTIYGLVAGMGGVAPAAGSTSALVQATTAGSYTDAITSSGAFTAQPYFGYFNYNVEASGAAAKLELYEMLPTASGTAASKDLGYFTLTSAGALSFTAFQAIPEPSTYAALLGVATLGFAAIRRRKQAQLLA